MRLITHYPWPLAPLLLLAAATPALANVIAPSAGFMPGLLPLALWLALPASVLAAFLERGFVTRAGVRRDALWFALQANLLSLAVGYLLLPVALVFLYSAPLLWCAAAVSISVLAEGEYYRLRALREPQQLRWKWVILGNLCSSLVLLALPLTANAIKRRNPTLVWELEPYHDTLLWGSVAGSALLFAAAWVVPAVRDRWRRRRDGALEQDAADVSASQDSASPEAAAATEQGGT